MTLFLLLTLFGLVAAVIARAVNVTMNIRDGRQVKVNVVRGLPFFVVAAAVLEYWLSFTTVDASNRGVVLRFGADGPYPRSRAAPDYTFRWDGSANSGAGTR